MLSANLLRPPNISRLVRLTLFVSAIFIIALSAGTNRPAVSGQSLNKRIAGQAFVNLPLSFAANQGQAEGSVKFVAAGDGYDIRLTASELLLRLRKSEAAVACSALLRMNFAGANISSQVEGIDSLSGKLNFLRGNDPANWQKDVPTFARVRYREVYPGINAIFYGNQRQLEYDFVVAPQADPQQIKLAFDGADRIRVDDNGDLLLTVGGSEIKMLKPFVYQETNGVRREITASYALRNQEIGFELGDYDHSRQLVIDPVLSYASFLGGSGEEQAADIAVDNDGNLYVTGSTASTDFPTANSVQSASAGSTDIFVTRMKINADGTATLIYSTYIGGRDEDRGNSLAVDAAGNAYVAGVTTSTNFPTANAFQTSFGSSAIFKSSDGASQWTPRGNGLSASTVTALSFDPATAETIYAATTGSGVFKSTDGGGVWQSANGDRNAQTPKLLGSSDVRALAFGGGRLYAGTSRGVFSTTDGGLTWNAPQLELTTDTNVRAVNQARESVRALAVDPANPAIVYTGVFTGMAGGIFKSADSGFTSTLVNTGLPNLDAATGLSTVGMQALAAASSTTLYAGTSGGVFKTTDSGGNWTAKNSGLTDTNVTALAIDPLNANVVYAGTPSGVFKSTNGGDSWTASNAGLTSTEVRALAIDGSAIYAVTAGGVFKSTDAAANWTASNNGQTNTDPRTIAVRAATVYLGAGGANDAVLFKLSPTGNSLLYSTYFGGGARDAANGLAVDANGNAFITGGTTSANFPLQAALANAPGGGSDAFVAKLNTAPAAGMPSLIFSTFIGGSNSDQGYGIAVDGTGAVYLTGSTSSPNFPVTDKALQKTYGNDAPGGSADNASGDAFVVKLNTAGDQLIYSTFLGGIDSDVGYAIALGTDNSIYLTGVTSSNNFATTDKAISKTYGGKGDAFVAVLSAISAPGQTGGGEASLLYSTYLGGAEADQGNGIAVDGGGRALVTGSTASAGFPVADAINPVLSGAADAFISLIDTASGSSIFSTFLGGSGSDSGVGIAVDSAGLIYIAGNTASSNFPLSENALDKNRQGSAEAFIAKINQAAQPADLAISKQAVSRFRIGEKATYKITVSNSGPGVATPPLRVLDSLPAELSFDSFSGADWNCTAAGQLITCISTKALAANASATFDLTVNVIAAPAQSQPLVNTASVSSLTSDAVASNNSGSSTVNTVEAACSFAIAPTGQNFTAAGGTGNVMVTTQDGCAWQASINSGADFITIEGIASSNNGSGSINFSVAANNSLNPRSGALTIAGQTFTITQAGMVCQYAVTPETQAFDENGGTGAVTITTTTVCTWQVVSDSQFVVLTGAGSGIGNGMVRFSVAPNQAVAQRAGTLTVTGRDGFSKKINILQGSATQAVCTFALSPSSAAFGAKGGDRAFFVQVSPDSCEWTATTASNFINITSDANQSGSAYISYLIPPNTLDAARAGSIAISQLVGSTPIPRQTFTITQDSQTPPPVVGCAITLTIPPFSQNFTEAGGEGMLMVGIAQGCSWQAMVSKGANFINIESGANGNGSGTIKFRVAANTTNLARDGTLTINGKTVFIRQSGVQTGTDCMLAIDPASRSFAAKGGDGAFFVNSSLDTCEWTAVSSAGFIKITSDRDQSGSAYITFTVDPNTGNADRAGTIVVTASNGATHSFTVTQTGLSGLKEVQNLTERGRPGSR